MITALPCGERSGPRGILFYRDLTGALQPAVFQSWLVLSGPRRILIDAGLPKADDRLASITGAKPTQGMCEGVIDPLDVTDVILTHLHWDHVGDVELFTNATIHVQRRELSALTGLWGKRPAFRDVYAADAKISWLEKNPRLNLIDGEQGVARGVRVAWVGGHTPGSQIVILDLDGVKVVFTGDNVNQSDNLDCDIPPGLLWSMPEALDALERIRDLVRSGYAAIPSHERKGHPPAAGSPAVQVAEIATQLREGS